MIYFEKLNKNKVYLGLQYGQGLISKKIREYSKQYAPGSKRIPTHVLGLVFEEGEWHICESHARGFKTIGIPSGVRRMGVNVWKTVEGNSLNQFEAFELELNPGEMKKHLGENYSLGDIRSLLHAALFHNNGKQKDRKGLICSEYMALCFPKICEVFNLPAWCITPAHFQNFIDSKGGVQC